MSAESISDYVSRTYHGLKILDEVVKRTSSLATITQMFSSLYQDFLSWASMHHHRSAGQTCCQDQWQPWGSNIQHCTWAKNWALWSVNYNHLGISWAYHIFLFSGEASTQHFNRGQAIALLQPRWARHEAHI